MRPTLVTTAPKPVFSMDSVSSRYVHQCQVKLKFHLTRHVSTRHDSTRSTRRAHAFWLCLACRTAQLDALDTTARLARRDELDYLDMLCNFYKVMITVIYLLFNISYSQIYWFHIYLVYFICGTNRICVNYESNTLILFVGIRHSLRDLLSDLNNSA